jgi:hypothetical protein
MTPNKSRAPRPGRISPQARSSFADVDALLEAAEAVRAGRSIASQDRELVARVLMEARGALVPKGPRTRAGKQAEGATLLMRYYGLTRKAALLHVIDDPGPGQGINQTMFARVGKAIDRLIGKRKARQKRTKRL